MKLIATIISLCSLVPIVYAQNFELRTVQGSCVKQMVSNHASLLYAFNAQKTILVSSDSGAHWQVNSWQPYLPTEIDFETKQEMYQRATVLGANSRAVYCGITMAGTDYMGYPQGGGVQSSLEGKHSNARSRGSVWNLYVEDSLMMEASEWHVPRTSISLTGKGTWDLPSNTMPPFIARVGAVMLGSGGVWMTVSTDTFRTIGYYSLPDKAVTYHAAASANGIFVVSARKNDMGDYYLYYSTTPTKTWQVYGRSFPYIESMAFVGNTLVVNTQEPCSTVTVEDDSILPHTIVTYPNPADDILFINSGSMSSLEATISVVSMQGESIAVTPWRITTDLYSLDLRGWEQGTYTALVSVGSQYKTVRFVVIR